MQLVVKLVGTGTERDPYRTDFPTYELLSVDYTNKVALVRVPDEDLPVDIATDPELQWMDTPRGISARVRGNPTRVRIQQHLRTRYPSAANIERLDIVVGGGVGTIKLG